MKNIFSRHASFAGQALRFPLLCFYDIEKATEEYASFLSKKVEWNQSGSYMAVQRSFENPRRISSLLPYLENVIKRFAEREVAIRIDNERKEGYSSSRLSYEYPRFKNWTVAEKEQDYRNAANLLMQKITYLTNEERRTTVSGNDNVRILEPISYRGKNKIVLVTRLDEYTYVNQDPNQKILPEDGYKYRIVVFYNKDENALSMLIKAHQQAIGGSLIVRDRNGSKIHSFQSTRP